MNSKRFREAAAQQAAEITRLILRERAVVFGYIMTQTASPSDAEDVFQDVCTTVCEKFHEFAAGGNFQLGYPLGDAVFVFGLPRAGR